MKRRGPMRVLIAYDGSAGSELVLEQLRRRRAGLPDRAQARVLTVADMLLITPDMVPGGVGAAPESVREMTVASRQVAKKALARAHRVAVEAARSLHRALPGWTVQPKAAVGSAGSAILSQAEAWRADLIVLGWRGQRLAARWLLGSTAQRVVHHAPCSVRIVRGRLGAAKSPVSLVIGVDGSPESEAAVQAMAARHWPRGSSARVVAAVADRSGMGLPDVGELQPRVWAEWQRQQREWFTGQAQRAADILARRGLPARAIVKIGDAKRVLVQEAERWDADTLAVGATGVQGLMRLFLGSTAAAVSLRAHCSVEVTRGIPRPGASGLTRRDRARSPAPRRARRPTDR